MGRALWSRTEWGQVAIAGLLLLLLVSCIGALTWAVGRARELFVLSIEDGRTRLVRGHAPPGLLEALRDVFARAAVPRATVKVVKSEQRARIESSGLDEPTLQRARNVLGTFPMHKLVGPQR
jgi:hypothetical protein